MFILQAQIMMEEATIEELEDKLTKKLGTKVVIIPRGFEVISSGVCSINSGVYQGVDLSRENDKTSISIIADGETRSLILGNGISLNEAVERLSGIVGK